MSTLKFLFDENVDVGLASVLTARGHDVARSPKGLRNGAVASLARTTSSVLLTNDVDFTNTTLFPPKEYAGIVVVRIHPPDLAKLRSALARFLDTVAPEKIPGRLFVLSEEDIESAKE